MVILELTDFNVLSFVSVFMTLKRTKVIYIICLTFVKKRIHVIAPDNTFVNQKLLIFPYLSM